MGGSGKTVIATALVSDPAVLAFRGGVLSAVWANPIVQDLQKMMHFHMLDKPLDVGLSQDEAINALKNGAKGRQVLCVLDDVWSKDAYTPFSRVLTRAQVLVWL